MCTLLFRHKPGDEVPLALLSNRDERYGRASGGWAWRDTEPRTFAPIDLEAGGTWMGLSTAGVVVALTNIFPQREAAGLHSRGALVQTLLELPRAADGPALMESELAARRYNNFNLLVADREAAFLFVWTESGLESYDLLPGVYQVANDPYGGAGLTDTRGTNGEWIAGQAHLLAEHPVVCKHGDEYGTCSSAKILLDGEDPARSRVWQLEGHPCEEEYTQVLGLDKAHARQPAG